MERASREQARDVEERSFGDSTSIPLYDWKGRVASLKFDTTKTTRVALLPRTLMIHLQRYSFDYDRFCQIKVNDHLEFPGSLQLPSLYLVRGGGDSSRYSLSGILVHRGRALSGHYTCYLKNSAAGSGGTDISKRSHDDPLFNALRESVVEIGERMARRDTACTIVGSGPAATATLQSLTSLLTARAQPHDGPPLPPSHTAASALCPVSPSEAESAALSTVHELTALLSNVTVSANSSGDQAEWLLCDDDRISPFDAGGIANVAFGNRPLSVLSAATDAAAEALKGHSSKKKRKKKQSGAAVAASAPGEEEGSTALLLMYQREDEGSDQLNKYLNKDNVLKLANKVNAENRQYWRDINSSGGCGSGSSRALVSWLCAGGGGRVTARTSLQMIALSRLVEEPESERDTDCPAPGDLLPGTAHWLLNTLCTCALRDRDSLVSLLTPKERRGGTTGLLPLLLQALRLALSVHPFPANVRHERGRRMQGDQTHLLNRAATMEDVRALGALADSFADPFLFCKAVMSTSALSKADSVDSLLDILDLFAAHSAGSRRLMLGEGALSLLLTALRDTHTAGDVMRRGQSPLQRRVVTMLACLLKPSSIDNDATEVLLKC